MHTKQSDVGSSPAIRAIMEYSKQIYMNRTKTLDPLSLKKGDKIEVCMCDTSATCVYSFFAKVVERHQKFLSLEKEDGTEIVYDQESIDGCYTYLLKDER